MSDAHGKFREHADRYVTTGQYTQRIFESVLAGCAPIVPAHYRAAGTVVPAELHACTGAHVGDIARSVADMAVDDRARLVGRCLRMLGPFRLSRQISTVNTALDQFGGR